jgi:hypothetical protein
MYLLKKVFFMIESLFRNERGQAIALDLAISITIFMIILAALLTIGGNQTTGGEKEIILQEMHSNAEKTLDFLTRYTGEWDRSGIVIIPPDPTTAYWEMEVESGDTILDVSGHGLNATMVPPGSWVFDDKCMGFDCKTPQCIMSPTATAAVSRPDHSLFHFGSSDFTITGWFFKSLAGNTFISKWGSGAAGTHEWQIVLESSKPTFNFESGTTTYKAQSTSTIGGFSWNYLTVSRSGGEIKIYVNGQPKGTLAIGTTAINSGTNDILMGTGLMGCLDDIKIYSWGLTDSEVQGEYNGTPATPPAPPIINPREKWEGGIDNSCLNWPATDNVVFVGLAGREGVLSQPKVSAFVKCANFAVNPTGYEKMKSKILMNYDYFFRLLDSKGKVLEDPIGTKLMTGRQPLNQDINTSIILRRAVSYEGTDYKGEAIAELLVYR